MTPARIWFLYVVLLVLSVPWYWPADSGMRLVFGIPLWAAVSLGCYLAAAIVTALSIDVLWRAQVGADEPSEPRA